MNKVFGIGFHKTGTSSLARALEILGYRVTGPNGSKDSEIADKALHMVYELADQFDAFQDNPWPLFYKELDKRYPGSKFILTVREPDSWIRSQVNYFGENSTPMRTWIYGVGCPAGNEDIYLNRYNRHNKDVIDYFKDRHEDLLVIDITKKDCWEEICDFLGHEIPDVSFPHVNKTKVEKVSIFKFFPFNFGKRGNRPGDS
ncbi:MAG: sulfotransferase [Gammaproteobacteria bacterium]|jgi:hypothetical protein